MYGYPTYPVYQNNNDGFGNSWWAIFIVIIGAVVGMIGSSSAVKKYLKV